MVKIYWQESRNGQKLILDIENGETITLGAVRKTKNGFDAFATTLGYDPGRAVKGIPELQDAKIFVESFEPWDLFQGGDEALPIETDVRAM